MISRITMAMIAYALNETEGNEEVAYRKELRAVTATQARDALILSMKDGSKFKVTVEAM